MQQKNAKHIKTPDTWPKTLHEDSPPLPTERPVGPDVETMARHKFVFFDHGQAMIAAHFNCHKKKWTDEEFVTHTQHCLVNDADKK